MVDAILKKKREDQNTVYLVHSQEQILLDNFQKKYVDTFIPKEERAFNLHIKDLGDGWFEEVKNMAQTLPVIASYRHLVLKTRSMKGEDWKRFGESYSKFPETTKILFLCCGDIDGRLKIVRAMKEEGGLFPINLSSGSRLRSMIEMKFKKENLAIASSAVSLLESSFSRDLGRLGQEIQKAILYFSGKSRVTEEDLKEIISHDAIVADTAIFELVDYVGRREMGPAILLMQEMLRKGENAIYILTMLARQFRLILLSKDLSQEESSPALIAKRLKEHPYPIKKALIQSKNFTFHQLERILRRIYEANLHIVTGRFKASLALEILLFELKEMTLKPID